MEIYSLGRKYFKMSSREMLNSEKTSPLFMATCESVPWLDLAAGVRSKEVVLSSCSSNNIIQSLINDVSIVRVD